jgi:Leucine-rich repeat (LRR) protein
MAPDSDIDLNVIGGAHQGRRTNRDVAFMQVTQGKVTHFPDLSRVVATFPNMNGFGIHFTQMKHINRDKLKDLGRLKFFLINDNEIEEIPADTFLDLKNLELIDICRNKIKRLDSSWLTTMPKLRVFKARTNKFQLIPANMFRNNPQLEEILFDYNEIARSEVDFMTMKNLKLVAMLQNKCVDIEYCKDASKKCIHSLEQFSHIVTGYCGVFNN